jgi:large subunit ribosomal protein L10
MRDEKQLLLNEIKDKIDGSTSLLVAQYEKLPPNGSWELRSRLAKKGSIFEVVRKRVFLKAASQAGIQLDTTALKGHIGVVFVSQPDAIDPAKELLKFSDENGQSLQMVCGHIEGKFISGADVETLSKLPGIDEMRSQMIALFVSPMSYMLSVLDAAMSGPLSEQQSQKE